MAILATVRCRNMKASLAFYTGVLDFERVGGDDDLVDPCFSTLSRNGDRLLLSSHSGDGEFEQVIVVTTDDVFTWTIPMAIHCDSPSMANGNSA